MMNKLVKRIVFTSLGLIFSVIPPALAVLLYFPVWVKSGAEYVVSGFAALLMIISLLPLFRLIRRALKSPSAYVIWLILFLVFLLVSRIADQMIVISFTGLVGSLIGAIFFGLAKRCRYEE